MLGLADSQVLMDASVSNNMIVGTDGEILLNEGDCDVLGLPKNLAQTMPTEEEINGELYVPPSDPGDVDLPPVDECVDVPGDAVADGTPSLTRVHDTLFISTCQFSACHAGGSAAAGLDLNAADLHTELMEHVVQGNTDLPLVDPGNPEGSWLYQRVAQCNPTDASGGAVSHMPLNSPQLARPEMVALLREWISAGALDD